MQTVEYDPDRDIDALLKKHASEIAKLRKMCLLLLRPEHDDIFLLRYILSNGSADKSREGVAFAVEWFSRPLNRFFFEKVERGEDFMKEMGDMGLRMVAMHKQSALDGGPVQLVRQGLYDMDPIVSMWQHEEIVRFNDLMKYQAWLECDRVTRETRRLVKLIVVNDFRGTPMRRPHSAWMSAFSESSKTAEKVFPQLIQTNAMVNSPSWFGWLFAIVKLFLPKRTLEKIRRCGGDTGSGDIASCPFVQKHFAVDAVPSYIGGKCACEGGCIPGAPNCVPQHMPRQLTAAEIEAMRKLLTQQREQLDKDYPAWLELHKQAQKK